MREDNVSNVPTCTCSNTPTLCILNHVYFHKTKKVLVSGPRTKLDSNAALSTNIVLFHNMRKADMLARGWELTVQGPHVPREHEHVTLDLKAIFLLSK